MSTDKTQWKKFGFESVLIISSILVALAVDSWWDNRQKRAEEQVALTSLLAEFERNKVELDQSLSSYADVQRAGLRLLKFAGRTFSDNDKDNISDDIDGLYTYYTFDPSTGALESVLGAGQQNLISNDELRARLAGWSGIVRDYKDDESEVDQIAYRELGPMLDVIGPHPILEESAPGIFMADWQSAFADLEFLNKVTNLSVWAGETVREGSAIETELDEIIALIELELDN